MQEIIFYIEDLEYDLAWQFVKGYITNEEFLDYWENLTLAYAGGNNGGMAV